jgi:CRISPR-associated endonuclease Csn1
MKKILGLDIGTNSIGGALININEFGKEGSIEWMGSRIIPLDGDSLFKFENGGQVETKAAGRRLLRGSRRLKQRYKLRRSRLIKTFKLLSWISQDFPENFKEQNRDGSFNINDYLSLSETIKQEAYREFGTDKISDDWLIYYLRKKALTERITLQELARIIYMLNQRRGFKSSRKEIKLQDEGEEEKWPKYEKWIEILEIKKIAALSKEKDKTIYQIEAGNYTTQIPLKFKPDWEGKEIELEVTRKTTKAGEISYSFKKPETSDWEKQKAALHKDIYEWFEKGLCKTIGEYFFIHLREDKNYRIRQRIVERELYKQELNAIWETQKKFHKELSDPSLLPAIAKTLYQFNTAKQNELTANDLLYLFTNDIIYYQRPLKSQKNSIDVCRFETKSYQQNGETFSVGVKVTPKSSPEFQEFRIWQDIHNLRIYQREGIVDGRKQVDFEVTSQYINSQVKALLFTLFNSSAAISDSAILKTVNKSLNPKEYFINLFANRDKLKGNETKSVLRKVFKKHDLDGERLLNDSFIFQKLWHILYSLNEEKEIQSALKKLKDKNGQPVALPIEVINHLSKLPELPKQYAAYSSKAIKKLLPLMRCGSYWNADDVLPAVAERIEKIIRGEINEDIDEKTIKFISAFAEKNENYCSGMPVWLATYAVYGKHSERNSDEKYNSSEQINVKELIPANSLRNPFVEQVIRETLQVVKEVWQRYGQPDEIHIELARELKKTAEEKAEISDANNKNYQEKERIKKLLAELKEGNPQSLADIEKFRLWKSNGGSESSKRFDELFNKKNEFVSASEVERYRLWADQNHLSPYTGKPIPLSQLFNKALYEVEHIFPRSRFFDDSFANKVICEAGVNKEKDKSIARLFIQQYSGHTFERSGQKFTILDEDSYVAHCKRIFKGKKLRNLLAETIPSDFVSRQLNDTRYISKKLSELLYPISKEKEGVIFSGGSITSELKDKWGLNKVWKEILKSRFERLQEITGEEMIVSDATDVNKFHFAKEYKRVDHRHHALDALIIAATTREHIRYLNTLSAAEESEKLAVQYRLVKSGIRDFVLPWPSFTQEAKEKLNGIIVSHKTSNRVVTKPFNKYLKWVEKDGVHKKEFAKQLPPKEFGKSWTAVRRSMFKEPQGIIYLKEIVLKKINDAIAIQIEKEKSHNKKGQLPPAYIYDQQVRPTAKNLIKQFNGDLTAIKTHLKKSPLKDENGNTIDTVRVAVFKEYAAKRVTLDGSFDEKKISKIPYAHHQQSNEKKKTLPQILREHLKEFGKPEAAFVGEGLGQLYKKLGSPLRKVTIYEAKDPETKFKGKYYETDKGGNVFFVIKQSTEGKRKMYTLPLLEAIERLANKLPLVDVEEGWSYFTLSPNELVYVPEENENIKAIDWTNTSKVFDKVYKMVSCSGTECYFLPHNTANLLLPYNAQTKKGEFGSLNKTENTINGISIKRNCVKIKTDRLGNIIYPVKVSLLDSPGESFADIPTNQPVKD